MAGTTADKLAKLEETKEAIKTAINDPAIGDKFSDYPVAITEGKAYIAQKITEKGVPTDANATFRQIGDNVSSIRSAVTFTKVNFSYTTVTETCVLIYLKDGARVKDLIKGPGTEVSLEIDSNSVLAVYERVPITTSWLYTNEGGDLFFAGRGNVYTPARTVEYACLILVDEYDVSVVLRQN